MKKQFLKVFMMAFLATVLLQFSSLECQEQLGKLLQKKNKGEATKTEEKKTESNEPKPYPQDFEDETGVSGTYYAIRGINNPYGSSNSFQKTLKLQFMVKDTGPKGTGALVNKLVVYYTESGGYQNAFLIEKIKEKSNITVFDCSSCDHILPYNGSIKGEIYQIEPGVLAVYDGQKSQVVDVWVKDKTKHEVYDLETATAKYDQFNKERLKAEYASKKQVVMGYAAYKENVGKVVFVPNYATFNYQYSDKPTEDAKNFLKSHPMGKNIFWGAYLDMPSSVICGSDCQWNAVYEIEGIKTSRVELRNKNRKWNQMVSEKKVDDRFCMNSGYTLIDNSKNIWDYAYVYALYQNKDKFQLGKTYKMNVKIFTNKDGNDQDLLAEGAINLVYDQESKTTLDKMFLKFTEFLNE